MDKIRKIQELNKLEIEKGLTDTASWHDQFRDSAYVYAGGFDLSLTEGDLICIFSQYGEIVDMNLVRDKLTGKSKGFAFLAYEDQRSTVLAVDNLNGFSLLGRVLSVDHVAQYRGPKKDKDYDEEAELEKKKQILPRHLQPVILLVFVF